MSTSVCVSECMKYIFSGLSNYTCRSFKTSSATPSTPYNLLIWNISSVATIAQQSILQDSEKYPYVLCAWTLLNNSQTFIYVKQLFFIYVHRAAGDFHPSNSYGEKSVCMKTHLLLDVLRRCILYQMFLKNMIGGEINTIQIDILLKIAFGLKPSKSGLNYFEATARAVLFHLHVVFFLFGKNKYKIRKLYSEYVL